MGRRAINATDLLGEDHRDHNAYLDSFPSRDPSPLDLLIASEDAGRDDVPRILLTGCRAWPVERLPVCGACKGSPMPVGWHCLVCSTPRGSLVASETAKHRRARAKAEKDRLKGGVGGGSVRKTG